MFIFKDNNISWYNCINKCEEIDALISIHRRKPTYAFLSDHSPHCDPVFRVCIFVDCLWVFRMWRGEQEREIYREGAQSWALSEVLHFSFGILRIAPFDITKKLNLPNPSLSDEICFAFWPECLYLCWEHNYCWRVFDEDKMYFIHVPETEKAEQQKVRATELENVL